MFQPARWIRAGIFEKSNACLPGILSRIDDEVRAQRSIEPLLRLLDSCTPNVTGYFQDHGHSKTAARALTLKTLNLCLGKYHFLGRDAMLLSRPYGLIVDPVNNCNLACPGCVHSKGSKEHHRFDWNMGFLPAERYATLLSRYGPYAIQITLCNYGEPLLNSYTPHFIRMAKAYLMCTMLSTNLAVKRFDAEAYAASSPW